MAESSTELYNFAGNDANCVIYVHYICLYFIIFLNTTTGRQPNYNCSIRNSVYCCEETAVGR